MTRFARSTKAVVGVALGMLALGSGFEACGSSSGGGAPEGFNGNDASTGGEGGGVKTTCANPTLNIIFSPMYSAYIPGSMTHTFQIPAVLDDGSMATWSVSDTSKLSTPMPGTFGGLPGVMLTVTGTGSVTVIATKSDGSCGTSTLNITPATEDDWTTGNSRYNDGVSLHFGRGDGGFPRPDGGFGDGGFMRPDGGFMMPDGSFFEEDGGTACTNCHGASASTAFNDVAHTPEQTGGFSDQDLINIIVNGEVPDGGYFDPGVIIPGCEAGTSCADRAYQLWHSFHQWSDIQPDQYTGMVAYLRSLTPADQMGTSNFGGHHHRDGGMPPMGDSGGPPPNNDSGPGPSSDAASE